MHINTSAVPCLVCSPAGLATSLVWIRHRRKKVVWRDTRSKKWAASYAYIHGCRKPTNCNPNPTREGLEYNNYTGAAASIA